MTFHEEDEHEYSINSFVQLLVSVVDQAASSVHKVLLSVAPPTKYPTPYGGRLEWEMPGGNRMAIHLKDSAKIRRKKRWSQVMYMYYLLGFRLMSEQLGVFRKQRKADHTFILSLDGDVEFEPSSLILLVDLMKRNERVGAACGRIHPSGSGPMVWYQVFEYAIGHWLQKSTEHVIGCVLCSPGCYSLMRGSALMADNVMKKYTTIASQANEHIQYDLGEDRWLCTLLLQEGHRVEYCAASDSYTFVPESFNEFFNQRRRWMPSTMANVIDLLTSWRHTTAVNENLSSPYMFYQTALLFASLVGPGTIFMMMTGALTAALSHWVHVTLSLSAVINLIPVVIFVVLCYTAKAEVQLWFALVMAAVYCLVQMLVLVGTIVTMAEKGPCFPTTIFFFFVFGTFLLCALLHPQEFSCVIHGFVYFLMIPTMYMILMIYAFCNLHIVSWGTREVKKTASEMEAEAERRQTEEMAKKLERKGGMLGGMMEKIYLSTSKKRDCRCGNLLNISCCSKQDAPTDEEAVQAVIATVANIDRTLTELQSAVRFLVDPQRPPPPPSLAEEGEIGKEKELEVNMDADAENRNVEGENAEEVVVVPTADVVEEALLRENAVVVEMEKQEQKENNQPEEKNEEERVEVELFLEKPLIERNEMQNPAWIEDPALGLGPVKSLRQSEVEFFEDLIEKYLKPIRLSEGEEKKMKDDLKDLRNRMSIGFIFVNSVFVITVFVLQANTEFVGIPWFCKDLEGNDIKLDPLGATFMAIFGVIVVIQIGGMILHRTSTFLHIMASTFLTTTSAKDQKEEDTERMIQLARQLGNLNGRDDDGQSSTRKWKSADRLSSSEKGGGSARKFPSSGNHNERGTAAKQLNRKSDRGMSTVERAFEKRWKDVERNLYESNADVDRLTRRLVGKASGGTTGYLDAQAALKTLRQRQLASRQSILPAGNIVDGGTTASEGRTATTGNGDLRRPERVRFTVGSDDPDDPFRSIDVSGRSHYWSTHVVNEAFVSSDTPEPEVDYGRLSDDDVTL